MGIESTTTSYAGGDYTWLASQRGTEFPKSGTLDVSAFTLVNGGIPSGTPLAISSGKYVPAATTSSAATLAGFLFHDIAVPAGTGGADQPASILTDATIVASKVPGTHDLTDGRYLSDQRDDAT